MANGFAYSQHHQKCCIVCGEPISALDVLMANDKSCVVCHSVDCQRVIKHKRIMQPALYDAYFEFNKKLIRQNRAQVVARKKYREEVTAKEQEENRQILHTFLKEHPELVEDDVHLVAIPSGRDTLYPLEQARIDKYVDHISAIISDASGYSNAAEVVYDEHHAAHEKNMQIEQNFEQSPQLHHLCDQLCIMCKGGCCAKGGEHAYLSVFSMRRYMDDHPELSPADIRQQYVSNIVSESIEGACINQTKMGCALPRELRSDICNGFYCDTVKDLQQSQLGKPCTGAILVVQRAYSNWGRFEPDENDAVRRVSLLDEAGEEILLSLPEIL